MTSEPEEFVPTANRWFSPTLEYVGRCKAEFSAPRGSVEGPATVSVDEAGSVSIELVPEPGSLRTECSSRYGLIGFLGGEGFAQEQGNGVTKLDPSSKNRCTRLEVQTPHGIFRTENVLYYGTEEVWNSYNEVRKATFMVGLSSFEAAEAGDWKYWVLPLSNFFSECRQWRSELDRHPLRVFPTPEVPDEITHVPFGPDEEEARKRAILTLHAANSKNQLIIFEFAGDLGFVERLPDYSESEQLLREGKDKRKTTAMMVGHTAGNSVESLERMKEWFPFDVLSLLTLATGTEVGFPWVEIRDEEGRLVRRFHGRFGIRPFRKGRRLIEEIPLQDSGLKATGRLIECACSRSKEFGETFVRAAIVHLVRARHEDQTLDDSMSHLARGFETLCKRYGTSEQVLNKNLSPAQRQEVRDALADAAHRIRASKGAADSGQLAALDRIAARARSADQTDKAFGVAVGELLKAFWLPDAQILEEHYRGRPSGWGEILAHYRGDVTHHGYLDILEAGHDVQELVAVRDHLHDALARVILKILDFDGGYHPGVVPYLGAFAVDWVKPRFTAQALGYDT